MSKARGKSKPPVESEENNQESKPQADHPDERLMDFLRDRFPAGLLPSQSPKEEYPDEVEDRKPKNRGKKQAPVPKQLPKPKEK